MIDHPLAQHIPIQMDHTRGTRLTQSGVLAQCRADAPNGILPPWPNIGILAHIRRSLAWRQGAPKARRGVSGTRQWSVAWLPGMPIVWPAGRPVRTIDSQRRNRRLER